MAERKREIRGAENFLGESLPTREPRVVMRLVVWSRRRRRGRSAWVSWRGAW